MSNPFPDPAGSRTDAHWEEVFDLFHGPDPDGCDLFEGCSEAQIRMLCARGQRLRCAKGDVLTRGVLGACGLLVVLDGIVETRVAGRLLGVLGPGECTGEGAFLHGLRHASDVCALTDEVELLILHRDLLDDLSRSEPDLAARLLLNLSKSISRDLMTAGVLID